MRTALVLAALVGCTSSSSTPAAQPGDGPDPAPEAARQAAPVPDRALALVISRFGEGSKPLPAHLAVVGPSGDALATLDDPESNVFHKVRPWRDGLLTIGGDKARVVHWTGERGAWTPTVIWQESFGGKHDRMRDLEIGDVDGDGADELVVATHDQGVVAVLDEADGSWTPTELVRAADTFVHEIELGDLDGDGTPEIYATPSEPNRSSGQSQPGRVERFVYADGSYARSTLIAFEGTHAKEILVAELQDGPALFAVREGRTGPGGGLVEPVTILRLTPDPEASDKAWTATPIASLLGESQSRFLVAGNLDEDPAIELLATGMKSGVWRLDPAEDGTWKAQQVDGSSGGFEQAATLADLDEDGHLEAYIVSEPGRGKPRELRRYSWKDGRSKREILRTLEGQGITWGVTEIPWGAD